MNYIRSAIWSVADIKDGFYIVRVSYNILASFCLDNDFYWNPNISCARIFKERPMIADIGKGEYMIIAPNITFNVLCENYMGVVAVSGRELIHNIKLHYYSKNWNKI